MKLTKQEWLERAFSNPNSALQAYMMCSYLYYIRYTSVISDTDYDKLCKYLLDNFDSTTHEHVKLVDKGLLKAGTAFTLSDEDYPERVKQAAEMFAMYHVNESC